MVGTYCRRWTQIFTDPSPGLSIFVAQRNHQIVGFTSLGPARTDQPNPPHLRELYAIYIDQTEWGTGTGTRLWTAALAAADNAPIMLRVLKGNTRARRFYERHGFTSDGTETDYERGGRTLRIIQYTRPPDT